MWNNILETMDNKEEKVGVMTVIDFSKSFSRYSSSQILTAYVRLGVSQWYIHRAFLVARVTL